MVDMETPPSIANDAADNTTSPRNRDENPEDASSINPGEKESKPEIAVEEDEEEARGILQVIASTGKFWHDWEKLKRVLSFQLKQVLSEYPEAKMTTKEQEETYQELVKKLDEALHNFEEGPPFTLQRLCEILLAARHIYPNLSKLALALEKNLLVTSTLAVCTDPYPQALEKPAESDKPSEELQVQSSLVQNGVEPVVGDGDEIMTEVEEADIDDDMTIDMEALEEIVASSETNSTSTGNS
uniref:Serine/threonine-protein phosphatase 4 regulatory subunit 2 n=1 Tax=Populus davidiana TaxID=266767 RepID=A0A6M2EJ27_9ROSI